MLKVQRPYKPKLGLGDMVERVLHPIAVALNLPCLDAEKKALRPESPCAQKRDAINDFGRKIGIGN